MTIRDLDAAILAAIAQLAPEAYGVAIRQRVGKLLRRVPSVGTIHLSLTRLERDGLVRARTGAPTPQRGGRAKRLFTLSAAGSRALDRAQHTAAARVKALSPLWWPT